MPAIQRGHARKLLSGKWQLRYYDADGARHTGGTFPSKSAAMQHYRGSIEPRLNRRRARPGAHALRARRALPRATCGPCPSAHDHHVARAARTCDPRLRRRPASRVRADGGRARRLAGEAPGTVALRDRAGAPADARRGCALGLHEPEPGQARRSQPGAAVALDPRLHARRARRARSRVVEAVRAATGFRRGSRRAGNALDALPPRLDTPLLFPAPEGGLLNLDNFRRREWTVAIKTSGVATPARIYDLRSTFASNALAAGVTVFELARVMGTSVRMIEKHYAPCSTGPTTSSPVASTCSRPSRRLRKRRKGKWPTPACAMTPLLLVLIGTGQAELS